MDRYETDSKWHLDKKISITHMIATISAVGSIIVFGSNLNTRLTIVEQALATALATQRATDARQDANNQELRREMLDNYKAINDKLDRLIERGSK